MSFLDSLRGSLRQSGVGFWKPGGVSVKELSFSFKDPRASFKKYLSMSRGGNTYGEDMNCSVRLDSVRMDSLRNSMKLDSVRDSVRLDSLRDSVRLDSVRHDTWSESFNPVSEPSFVDNNKWRFNLTTNGGFSVRPSAGNGAECSENRAVVRQSQSERGWSLRQEDEEEVTESKIRAFLDEKALELQKLQTPLYVEFNDSLRASVFHGNGTSAAPAESFVAPLSPAIAKQSTRSTSKSPSKASNGNGRPAGTRSSQESETSVDSDNTGGGTGPSTSVSFNPLLEIPSPKLNELKGLNPDARRSSSSPGLSSSERQRLWKEELQQELQLKREEKRKHIQRVPPLSPSPNSRVHQRPGSSRLATVSQL